MKKIAIILAFVLPVAAMIFAAEKVTKPASAAKAVTYHGTVIDNLCATGNKANLGAFIKTHTKECALMPNCAASGYSLYMPDGKLMAFDKASGDKIQAFLKDKASKLKVTITATETNGELNLVSIKNQEMKKKPKK